MKKDHSGIIPIVSIGGLELIDTYSPTESEAS